MRILVLSSLYPPHALGGYEQACADAMERIAEAGSDVHVLTTTTRLVPAGTPEPAHVTTMHRDLAWHWDDHRIIRPGALAARRLHRGNLAALDRVLAEVRPDVVSVWGMGGMSLGLLDRLHRRGLPQVWVMADEWPVYGPAFDAWRSRLRRPVPQPRDAIVCWCSRWLRDRVRERTGWRPSQERITGLGIDERIFTPAAAGAEPRAWQWRLLAAGRIEPRKGFPTAVRALADLPAETTLRIAGPDDGEHAGALRALAAEIGAAERLQIAAEPHDRMPQVYAAADALLFPSAWQEPFGLVPLEAMACGVPVVAVPTGGATEFLRHEQNCLAVAADDAAGMAAACRRLASDPQLRRRLVKAGQATAAEHTAAGFAAALLAAHEAAIESAAP